MYWQTMLKVIMVLGCSMIALGGPPQAVLDPSSPGLHVPFSGDPDTTEEGCRGQEKDTFGHFLDCSWDFEPRDYGSFGNFQQGDWRIDQSGSSDDGQAVCAKRDGFTSGFCVSGTMRYLTSLKDTPTLDASNGHSMDPNSDWVFSFDTSRTIDAALTNGDSDFFQLHFASAGGKEGPQALGLTGEPYSSGAPGRYRFNSAGVELWVVDDLFDVQDVNVTVHYKAETKTLDFWFNDVLELEDFVLQNDPSLGVVADPHFIQLGPGRSTATYLAYDNLILGLLSESTGSIPGDANGDGAVDVADLGVLGANFGMSGAVFSDGDFNGDNVVDVADLGILGANWSGSQPTPLAQAFNASGLNSLIPEPSTVVFIAAGLVCLARRRRHSW